MDPKLEQGYFARKQLFSKNALIRWSHRRRFEVAVAKSARLVGQRMLDFGCGDGTYLAMLLDSPHAPREAVSAELDPRVVTTNQQRFADHPKMKFVLQSDLERPEYRGSFECIVCMECFEHMTEPDRYLALLSSLLRPGGQLLLSVPVETGLPVVLKQVVRRIAGWRKIGDYANTLPYSWSELAKSVFAWGQPHIPRIFHLSNDGVIFHCHKGFNWMMLRNKIARHFTIDRISASPIEWLSPHLASQAWFEAHKD
ncbi:MAG: class I SAM-dependent methyltransferase [Pedosphaera sp.]|nr:class I SAM-dependent methyltransferase [Pedosphaera sp.]